MPKNCRRSDCPISFSLDIFGDKWSLLILRDMIFIGKRTYGEFANSDEKMATNILADRLSVLENAGVIKKKKDKEKKSRFIYSVTDKGIELLPVLLEIIKWGATYDKDTVAPKAFVDRIKNDKEKLMKEIIEGIKNNKPLFAPIP
ncbi:MAG: helix-turn-helix transcriptional regulator [Bacteroidetes bacterium]|nr:helix-turn-helix transcriptional regulator [Bacteroidota bacterium]